MVRRGLLVQAFAIVVDIGKTLSKVTLWSRDGRMLDRQLRPNGSHVVQGLKSLDVDGIAGWLIQALSRYSGLPIEVIIPVGHGAGVVALGKSGPLLPAIDYEHQIPDEVAQAYAAQRDSFGLTGSPLLPAGLNLGSQLYLMETLFPQVMLDATLVPWAQYWSWFLSGNVWSEVSSLGCHTDVWSPSTSDFSPMAKRFGWADRFAPIAPADATAGTLRKEISDLTGIPLDARVLVGLHDSNAALLAAKGFSEISDHEATVLSTGTWFIAMRMTERVNDYEQLPHGRDCLVNVDVYGRPVPSARFMGGREIESIIQIDTRRVDITPDQPALLSAVPDILTSELLLMPNMAPGFGPFPHHVTRWINEPNEWYMRRAAACLYAALVADVSLDIIGSSERLLVEGRFAEAEVFVRALAALRPGTTVYTANAHNDVSFGALRLANARLRPDGILRRVDPLEGDLIRYRKSWRQELQVAS